MKKLLVMALLFVQCGLFANSVSLFNNSPYKLKATIFDASGNVLSESILNVRDATEWSDDYMNFGTENSDLGQMPYSVEWECMNGDAYATCNNVAAGSVVMAQNCQGTQECGGEDL